MRLIDADELMEHVLRDKLDSRELIAKMIDNAPTETVTEFADRCKECGARYGKLLKQKSDKWIPASEPPKTNGRYLTHIKNGPFSYIMVCDYIQQTWCPDDETVSNDVTHWMSLPIEPYEEVKE